LNTLPIKMAEGFDPNFSLGSQDTSYYRKLGIDPNSSKKDLEKKFRKLSKLYHPDSTRNSATEEAMKELNKMKSVLLNEVERRKYDEELATKSDAHEPLFMRSNRGSILLPPGMTTFSIIILLLPVPNVSMLLMGDILLVYMCT